MELNRLPLFPDTTQVQSVDLLPQLTIAGCSLVDLARKYGTPLYLYDQATLDQAVLEYRRALNDHYPAHSGITYAGKAFLCTAMAEWVTQQGLWVDCTGAGELAIAQAANTPRENILVHGVNKNSTDLECAVQQAGTIVIDNLTELQRAIEVFPGSRKAFPNIWLRLRPGIAVTTHTYTQTGQEDSKFGLSPQEFRQAVLTCLEHALPLTGIHFHQGSHFHDLAPLSTALKTSFELIASIQEETGWYPSILSPGGGWGVAYHESELPHPLIEAYVQWIAKQVVAECQAFSLPLPHLQLEPGRSLVARAGVAVYRVGGIKNTPHRRWLLLDGGLADNPRPALYGAHYSALPVLDPSRPVSGPAWLAGPFCESGDILIHDLPMPALEVGELIAVPVSGAYQLSMSSNYNGARKPSVLWLHNESAQLIQRRETTADLIQRDFHLCTI